MKTKIKSKFWIRFNIYQCPVCGYEDIIRERVFDEEKPKELEKRYLVNNHYCGCEDRGL